jgi:hypothetical protein
LLNELIHYIYANEKTIGFCGHDLSSDALERIVKLAHREGMKDGVRRFAWWKDGTQYVGTCGTTLQKALLEL